MKPLDHEVVSDGRTVWINGEDGLLGRFGLNGIDVHRPSRDQSERGECLHCTHTTTTRADWDTFVAKMQEHFGVRVAAKHMPTRLKPPTTGSPTRRSRARSDL